MNLNSTQQLRIENIVNSFDAIYKAQMIDLPITNKALQVSAVGFRPWSTHHWERALLGILLTPWFMNLILIPEQRQQPEKQKDRNPVPMRMPAGDVEFSWSEEANTGIYLSRSLLSPVAELKTHYQGETLAKDTLSLLFTFPKAESEVRKQSSRREFFSKIIPSSQTDLYSANGEIQS